MNIPRLLTIPEYEVDEMGIFPVRELPIIRRSTVLLNEEDLSSKLSVDVQDVHEEMKKKELTQRYHIPYNFQRGTKLDTIRQCRQQLIEWMDQVGTSYTLCNTTIHVAVAILDRILSEMDISKPMLQLVASSCILIAAKTEELDEKVPTINQINYCTDNTYTHELIKQMEALILNKILWNINILTPMHFLGLYINNTLFKDELILDYPIGDTYDRVRNDVANFSEFFVDLCLQDFNFLGYKPSVIAASSVAITRRMLKITPIWSSQLMMRTNLKYENISSCCDHIWNVFETNYVLPGSPRSFS